MECRGAGSGFEISRVSRRVVDWFEIRKSVGGVEILNSAGEKAC